MLEPFLFGTYTLPLRDILHHHGLNHDMYADDKDLYISFSVNDQEATNDAITNCITCAFEVRNWMVKYMLKNMLKTSKE